MPVTSNVTRVFPFQVLLPASDCGLRLDSKAQAEQVRSVAIERVGRRLGQLPSPLMSELEDALRLHLDLRARSNTERRRLREDPRRPLEGRAASTRPRSRKSPRIPRLNAAN